MKRVFLLRGMKIVWLILILAIPALCTNMNQSIGEIIVEGFLWFALCVLSSILLVGIGFVIGGLSSKSGRSELKDYFEDSAALRDIKRQEKRAKRARSPFWSAFYTGLGFGAGWRIFNNNSNNTN